MPPMPLIDPSRKHSDLTSRILRAFYDVYNDCGFGFPESVYANALCVELEYAGVAFRKEVVQEIVYRGAVVGVCRFDIVVDGLVLVEVKASKALIEADRRQIISYLKASSLEVGLLLHFGPKPNPHRFIYDNSRK